MSVGSAAVADAAGISIVAVSTTIVIGIESHRALGGRVGCVIARPSGVVARAGMPAGARYLVRMLRGVNRSILAAAARSGLIEPNPRLQQAAL